MCSVSAASLDRAERLGKKETQPRASGVYSRLWMGMPRLPQDLATAMSRMCRGYGMLMNMNSDTNLQLSGSSSRD